MMKTAQRIVKNTALLFISQIIVYGFGFFTTMYSAQYLGTSGFGTLSLALALNGILAVFSDLGLSTLLTREVSREKELANKYLSNIIMLKVGLIILTLIILLIVTKIGGYSPKTSSVIYLMFVAYIFMAFYGVFVAIFQAHEKMEYPSIGNIINAVILLSGVIFAITYKLDIIFIASVYAVASFVVLVYYAIIYCTKFQIPSLEIDLKFCKITLKEAVPLSLAMIFALIHYRVDTVFLSFINGESAVGLYNAAYSIMTMLTFIPIVFTTAIYPLLSQFHVSSKDSLKSLYEFSFKILVILFIPISFGMTILAPEVIILIYKNAYYPSIGILQILIWTIPALFLSYLLGTLLTSINRQKSLFRAVIISTIFNVALNLILLPKFSYYGAAIATLASESLLCVIYFHFISRYVSKIKVSGLIWKPLIATAVMCIFIVYVKTNLILEIIIAIIIYFIVIFSLKTFSKYELSLLKEILNQKE